MGGYWDKRKGAAENLRLLTREGQWLAWHDQEANPEDPGSKRIAGAKARVEEALLQSLHSTNVLSLLGSGASFCANNPDEAKGQAPGMSDLWHAARAKVSEVDLDYETFDHMVIELVGAIPLDDKGKPRAGDIETLLSLCKMKLELTEIRATTAEKIDPKGEVQRLRTFIAAAESAILTKVNFVDQDTDLPAHKGFVQKLAKRTVDKPRVKVFTTNYDLCIEESASRLGVVLVDGFSHSAEHDCQGRAQIRIDDGNCDPTPSGRTNRRIEPVGYAVRSSPHK